MPVDWSRYPSDWKQIRARIEARAGRCCEWCGVPNHALIQRDPRDPARWNALSPMEAEVATLDGERVTRVVLTVHHVGIDQPDGTPGDRHDKRDCRAENLALLCQRCHLLADLDLHLAHAAETRRKRRIDAGQRELFTDGECA